MNHGEHHEPAHGEHHEQPEPERIPIDDPGENFVVMRKENGKWLTTHQGPNGDFYTISNDSTPEANMTLYNEDKRNAKLKDALANELYRLNTAGAPIRPAKSSEDFNHLIETAGVDEDLGNYDIGRTGSFISYGNGESGSNEMAAISERSASIVLSYQARDKALAEGKTLEEAQEIGAQVYREQEGYKETSRVSPGLNTQPETSSVSEPIPESSQLGDGRGGAAPIPELGGVWTEDTSRKRRFGRAASGGWFRTPPPPPPPAAEPAATPEQEETGDTATFLRNIRSDRKFANSSWIRDVSVNDMENIMSEVNQLRSELASGGVTDKKIQDGRIYRNFRMRLETTGAADQSLKQAHGVLWDLMGGSPKGEIPF